MIKRERGKREEIGKERERVFKKVIEAKRKQRKDRERQKEEKQTKREQREKTNEREKREIENEKKKNRKKKR